MIGLDCNFEQNTRGNLNFFSDRLTSELRSILESQFDVSPGDTELQAIGCRIVQFVALDTPNNRS